MAPETVDREKLKDALDEDAMSAYDEREKQLGEELMRYLERSILLQVIDNRWREHLYDMDYLREGIHLRGFAQIDPLVAYKNEGFAMFEELMHSIWEEFSKLVFNAEIEVDPVPDRRRLRRQRRRPPTALDYSGGTPEAQPSALQAGRGAGAVSVTEGTAAPRGGNGAPRPRWSRPWSRTSARKTSAATIPAGVGSGRSSRSATEPEYARQTGASRGSTQLVRFGSRTALALALDEKVQDVPRPARPTTPSS